MRHLLPFHCSASTTPAPEALVYVPTAMHELAAGQDTQKSWPVGITGFGLGVTDQPCAEALTGTEALAGIAAAPARTSAASRTDIVAALRLILPSGRFAQNFMITPMLQSQFAGTWAVLSGRKVENGAVSLRGPEGRGRARPGP